MTSPGASSDERVTRDREVLARQDCPLSTADATALMRIGWIWDRHYTVAVIDGAWTAIPKSDPGNPEAVLTAPNAPGLQALLLADTERRRSPGTATTSQTVGGSDMCST